MSTVRPTAHLGVVCLYVVSNITIYQEIDVGNIISKCDGDGTSYIYVLFDFTLLLTPQFTKKSTLVISL